METTSYALVGQFRGGKRDGLGLSLFRVCEDGSLTHLQTLREDVAAGWFCMDPDRRLIYAVQEKEHLDGRLGGGSCVYTFRFDPETERLREVGFARTLSASPSYICLDRERAHVIVSHNGSAGRVNRIRRNEDGSYRAETVFDDAAVAVLALEEDGVPGDIRDLYVVENEGEFGPRAVINEAPGGPGGILANPGTMAHLHCAALSPDGRVLLCSDFGQGKLHSFRYEDGRLGHVGEYEEEVDCGLRYIAFHPRLPLAYINCENRPSVLTYAYDSRTGALRRIGECAVEGPGCRDILLNPEGSKLYLTMNHNKVCVLDVLPDGGLRHLVTVPCQGNGLRALALSPDGRYLYCGCNRSDTVEVFPVGGDGMLSGGRIAAQGVSASAINVFSV